MFSIRPIFEASFWFDLFPVSLSPVFERGFFFFFAVMIFGGAIMRIVARKKHYDRDQKTVLRKIAFLLSFMGFGGLLWLFLTYQEVYIFGARFWILLWLGVLGYWVYKIIRFARVDLPKIQEARNVRKDVNEYMPKNRKKKGKKR